MKQLLANLRDVAEKRANLQLELQKAVAKQKVQEQMQEKQAQNSQKQDMQKQINGQQTKLDVVKHDVTLKGIEAINLDNAKNELAEVKATLDAELKEKGIIKDML